MMAELLIGVNMLKGVNVDSKYGECELDNILQLLQRHRNVGKRTSNIIAAFLAVDPDLRLGSGLCE